MNLVDFICHNKDQIAEEWIGFASSNIDLTRKMDRREIVNHIKQMLDRIIDDMGSAQTDDEQKTKSHGNKKLDAASIKAARSHGEQRLDFGFDFLQLSAEFRAMRASVLRLWEEESSKEEWKKNFHDMIRFNEAIDEAWMISLRHFQQRLDESKNLFLSILGHDLQSPVSTIRGALAILDNSENLSEEERKFLQYSDRSLKRMTELIKNLLELTELRLGSGLSMDKSEFDLLNLFEDIIDEQKLAFPEVDFRTKTHGPVNGNWDRLRLSQMMNNLIVNAVRHGEEGGTVKVKLYESDENACYSVHNNGPHIPEDILDKIFDSRFSNSRQGTSMEKGYGLGLLIVKEIVEGHGGEINVESDPESGTTFTAVLSKK